MGEVALPRNATGGADDLHAEGQAIHRRRDRGRRICRRNWSRSACAEMGFNELPLIASQLIAKADQSMVGGAVPSKNSI